MGTTRIKVIDLSSQQQEIATSRKRAERMREVKSTKGTESTKGMKGMKGEEEIEGTVDSSPAVAKALAGRQLTVDSEGKPATAESAEKGYEGTEESTRSTRGTKGIGVQQHHQGKKYLRAYGQIDKNKVYSASEALLLLGKTSYTRFDPTVEAHFRVMDKNVRGTVKLPYPLGEKKQRRVLVFGDKQEATSGDKNIVFGDEKTIGEIESGKLKPVKDFDVVVASPKFMPQLAKVAKILGPKGMMPSPKNGTVTDDWQKFLSGDSAAGYQYKSDPTAPVVHTKIGKLSNKEEELSANLKALILAIGANRIKKATLTTTMGPGIKVDVATVSQ